MAVAFRAAAVQTPSGNGTSTVVNKPTGTVDDDVMIANIYVEDDVAVTAPGGWSLIAQLDHPSSTYDIWVYWKRASGEGASYTWTHANTWRNGMISSFSGCITTGDPQDATATNANGTASPEVSADLTTVTNDAMAVVASGAFTTNNWSIPSGWSEAGEDDDVHMAYKAMPTAGAVGTASFTLSGGGNWNALTLALKPPAAGGGAVLVDVIGVGTIPWPR